MTSEELDTVLRLDVAGCNAWDIALEIDEDVYTVFRIVVNSEYLRAKAAALKVVAAHGADDEWWHHFTRLAAASAPKWHRPVSHLPPHGVRSPRPATRVPSARSDPDAQ